MTQQITLIKDKILSDNYFTDPPVQREEKDCSSDSSVPRRYLG